MLRELSAPFRTARRLAWVAIAAGIALRLCEYANNRDVWMDEAFLAENVVGRPIFELDRPLSHDQLAPPGFLIVARLASRGLGGSSYGLRFLPLVCGIASLFVLGEVARRSLSPRAVPIALALAAFSDDLIYYSTEFKQYSSDLLVALGCILLAWDLGSKALGPRRVALAAALGAAATWLSLPAAFVLAGGGLWLAGQAALGRRWRRLGALALVGLAWGAGFLGCFAVSQRLLGPGRFIWVWWDFAFLPLPPRSLAQAEQVFWQFVNVFTNPAGIVTPLPPIAGAWLELGLFAAGLAAFAAARKWGVLVVLTTPIVLALAASALHRYPFHGRVLLFLVPSFLLPLAEGVEAVGRRGGRAVFATLVALVLVQAVVDTVGQASGPRARMFDSHGDQRNDLLDYLEARSRRRPPPRGPRAVPAPAVRPPAAGPPQRRAEARV